MTQPQTFDTSPTGRPPTPPPTSSKAKADWSELERLMLSSLIDGPKSSQELKQLGIEHGWTAEQVAKVVATRWMDLPRQPGHKHFDPWTVFHPFSAQARRAGVSHAIDGWLLSYFGRTQTPRASKDIQAAAEAAGFTYQQLGTAYRRCQLTAFKNGHHWYRRLSPEHYDEALTVLQGEK